MELFVQRSISFVVVEFLVLLRMGYMPLPSACRHPPRLLSPVFGMKIFLAKETSVIKMLVLIGVQKRLSFG